MSACVPCAALGAGLGVTPHQEQALQRIFGFFLPAQERYDRADFHPQSAENMEAVSQAIANVGNQIRASTGAAADALLAELDGLVAVYVNTIDRVTSGRAVGRGHSLAVVAGITGAVLISTLLALWVVGGRPAFRRHRRK